MRATNNYRRIGVGGKRLQACQDMRRSSVRRRDTLQTVQRRAGTGHLPRVVDNATSLVSPSHLERIYHDLISRQMCDGLLVCLPEAEARASSLRVGRRSLLTDRISPGLRRTYSTTLDRQISTLSSYRRLCVFLIDRSAMLLPLCFLLSAAPWTVSAARSSPLSSSTVASARSGTTNDSVARFQVLGNAPINALSGWDGSLVSRLSIHSSVVGDGLEPRADLGSLRWWIAFMNRPSLLVSTPVTRAHGQNCC
jgi:hypothetical protein